MEIYFSFSASRKPQSELLSYTLSLQRCLKRYSFLRGNSTSASIFFCTAERLLMVHTGKMLLGAQGVSILFEGELSFRLLLWRIVNQLLNSNFSYQSPAFVKPYKHGCLCVSCYEGNPASKKQRFTTAGQINNYLFYHTYLGQSKYVYCAISMCQ